MTATDAPPPAYEALPTGTDVYLSLTPSKTGGDVLISIKPPLEPPRPEKGEPQRAPLDICAVIDVSGSMGDAATLPGEEATNLSILDVTKHALRTVMSGMGPRDRLALVTFHSDASVAVDLTFMDVDGKKEVDAVIEGLRPLYSTNLWDGLKTGMNLLNGVASQSTSQAAGNAPPPKQSALSKIFKGKAAAATDTTEKKDVKAAEPRQRVSAILLLTDGMPNVEPPRGHIPMLKSYLDSHPESAFSISTFGFGYSLDSPLLAKIAQIGGGHYGFVPDSGLVGTTFVHAMANTMATYAVRCTVDIEAEDLKVLGELSTTTTSWGGKIVLGDVQYGQSLDLVVQASKSAAFSVTVRYWPWTLDPKSDPAQVVTATLVRDVEVAQEQLTELKYHAHRAEVVELLHKSTGAKAADEVPAAMPDAAPGRVVQNFAKVSGDIKADPALANHEAALALAQDIDGQIKLALESQEFYRKWGRHYLPSLARAHQRQRCGNFKDPGLLMYGKHSPQFTAARDALDAAFDALPPPKGSRNQARTNTGAPVKRVAKMSVYNNSYGPCFAGSCAVRLEDGTSVRLDTLRRGMALAGGVRVGAVLRTDMPRGVAALCSIGSLLVTPWHPVFVGGRWAFPADVVDAEEQHCAAVYSVLLEGGAPALEIEGVLCAALGHGVKDDPVLAHAFLGDYQRVLGALANLPGFADPEGIARCGGVVRGSDGLICGFAEPAVVVNGAVEMEQTVVGVAA